jgi:toxin-antitoxin system PIN domain toxin
VIVVDTNILIHAADRHSEFHKPCQQRINDCRQGKTPWYLTWEICYEFLRVITHPAILAKPWTLTSAWRFLETILGSPNCGLLLPTSRHATVLAGLITELPYLRGNILHDVHTAALMREHGIRDVYTRDSDFSRFPFLNAIDPVA